MDRWTLGLSAFVVTLLAFYGWWRICDDYIDPFIQRTVERLRARIERGRNG